MTFLTFYRLADDSGDKVFLVSADTARGRRSVPQNVLRRSCGGQVICSGLEVAMTGVACLRRFWIVGRVDVASRFHAGEACIAAPRIGGTVTRLTLSEWIALIVKELRMSTSISETGRMGVVLVTLETCDTAGPTGKLLRMTRRTDVKVVLRLLERQSMKVHSGSVDPAGIVNLQCARRCQRQIRFEITARGQQ